MKKLLIVLFAMVLTMSSLTVGAQTIADLQQQQREIQNEAQGVRGELNVTRNEMEELEHEILVMDQILEEAEERLEEIEKDLAITNMELEKTELALEQAEQNRDEHFERFKTRLRVMYIHGPVGYLEVVLQATSFSDFLTRLDHMNTIARSDREMTERLQEAEDQVADMVEENLIYMERVEELQEIQEERIQELEDVLEVKYEFMARLEADAHQHEVKIRQLEQADQAITTQIQQLRAEEEARRRAAQAAARRANRQVVQPSGGRMRWPVPGRYEISSGYGSRRHPISGRSEFHSGIDIPAPNGTNIVAADSGTVIISGRMGGYGNTVVIDHGNGLSTLYGHNSRNLVAVGDWVNRGDVIARVGSTGVSTGPHLHFEVRHNGRHVNPGSYLGI